jgi:PAS domain-containing protein
VNWIGIVVWENTVFVIAAFIAGGITSVLALVALRRRFVPGAVQFGFLMLASALWSLAYAFELGSPALTSKLFWVKIEYIGIACVPLAWLVFILAYTGRERWLNRARLIGLGLIPAALIGLALTNPAHRLVWDAVEILSTGPYSFLLIHHTAGFYGFVLYSNALLLFGTGLVLRLAFEASRFYRKQATLVVLGTVVSWTGNILYVGNLNPVPGLDWTPFAFAITGLIFGLALFRYHFLDILPVARHAVFEGMQEGVVVLDERHRILDSNPAAEKLLEFRVRDVLGTRFSGCLPALPHVQNWFEQALEGVLEIELPQAGSPRMIEVTVSRLAPDQADTVGYLVLLHDVTSARRSALSLVESEERFRRLAEASQEGIILTENGMSRNLSSRKTSPKFSWQLPAGMKTLTGCTCCTAVDRSSRSKCAARTSISMAACCG